MNKTSFITKWTMSILAIYLLMALFELSAAATVPCKSNCKRTPQQIRRALSASNLANPAIASHERVIKVTTTGIGLTRKAAVTDALVSAINQVNGRIIDEHTLGLSATLNSINHEHQSTTIKGKASEKQKKAQHAKASLGISKHTLQGAFLGEGAKTYTGVNSEGQKNNHVLEGQVLEGYGFNGQVSAHGKASSNKTQNDHVKGEVSVQSHGSSESSSSLYRKLIKQRTHGAIKAYKILKLSQNKSKKWKATVRASIVHFEAPLSAMRRRIAVLPVTTDRSQYSIDGRNIPAEKISSLIGQAITNSLTGTRKFAVLDRTNVLALNKELSSSKKYQSNIKNAALIGQRLVADYALLIHIEKFQYTYHVIHFMDTNHTLKKGMGYINVSFKLIDPATSQVISSGSLDKKLSPDDLNNAYPESNSHLANMSRYIGEHIVKSITDQLYPVMIINANGNHVVIAEGSTALEKGESYKVFKYGRRLIDPYTHESLGRAENYIGIVKISRVTPRLAYGIIIDSSSNFASEFQPDNFVLGERYTPASRVKHIKKTNSNVHRKLEKMLKNQNSVFAH